MTDVASLGIKIDSSQAATAASELDKLTKAGKGAEDSISEVEKAARRSATATQNYGKNITEAYGITGNLNKAQIKTIRNLEDQIVNTSMSGVVLAQYNALRKAGTSADSEAGKVISDLAALQYRQSQTTDKTTESTGRYRQELRALTSTTKLANNEFGGMTGRLGQVMAGFRTLTPAIAGPLGVLLAIGAAAAYAVSTFKELAITADIADRTGQSVVSLAAVSMIAGNSGLDPAKMQSDMLGFSHTVDQARAGLGPLSALLRANQITVSNTEDAFFKVGDLVKNASSDAAKFSILQQAGLPATREMAKFMEQGSTSLRAQAASAAKIVSSFGDQAQIAKDFDALWNKVWTGFSYYGKSALLGTLKWFQDNAEGFQQALINPGGRGSPTKITVTPNRYPVDPNAFVGPTNPKPTVNPADELAKISRQQQYLGLLGQTSTVEQQVEQVTLQVNAAHHNGVDITTKQADALRNLARENALGITQIKASADATRVETDTFNMSVGAASAYAAVQTQINDAKRRGAPLTQANIDAIQREASVMGDAVQRLDDMRQASDLLSSAGRDFRTELMNGASAWDAFRKAGSNALGSIADKLIDMASKNLVTAAFGGASGSGGFMSLLASAFGGAKAPGSSPSGLSSYGSEANGVAGITGGYHTGGMIGLEPTFGRYVHPAYFDDAPRFHTGGIAGDEVPIIAKKGEGVFTPAQMRAMAPTGGASTASVVNINNSYVFNGVEPGMESRMRAYIDQGDKQSVSAAITQVAKINKNSPAYLR